MLVPQGKIAAGKLAQAIVHGAQVIMVRGNFDDCLRLSRGLADDYPVALVNSVNPMRLEGQKTAAFEIVDFLGDAPDVHVLPVGNAGNISAYWLGYREYADGRRTPPGRPRMRGWQAAGAAPLVAGRAGARPGDRSPRRSGSATPRRGTSPWRPPTSPAAGSARSATTQILAAQRELAAPRRRLRRARLGRRRRRAAARGDARAVVRRPAGRGHGDRSRPQGHRHRAVARFTDLVDTVGRRRRRRGGRGGRAALTSTVRHRSGHRRRCPATSANLGPGFDALGLALDLRDTLVGEVVDADGLGDRRSRARARARSRSTSGTSSYRAMRAAFDAHGRRAARPAAATATT